MAKVDAKGFNSSTSNIPSKVLMRSFPRTAICVSDSFVSGLCLTLKSLEFRNLAQLQCIGVSMIYIYTFKQFQWVSLTGPYQRLEKNVEENKYFEDFLSLRQAGVNLTKSRCSQFCSTDPTSFKQANVEGNILILFRLPRYNSL